MHVRYSAKALIAFLILLGTGCNDAIYTLGRLPADSEKRNSCRESASPGEGGYQCGASPSDGGSLHAHGDASQTKPPADARVVEVRDATTDAAVRPPPLHDACPNDRRPAVQKGLNLYLLVDDSLSVVLQPAWNSLTLALSAFVDDPKNAGLGVGIGYYGISCNAADYETPAVGVGPLPGTAQAIKASYPLPISGKAITPAVTGALSYARTVVKSVMDRDTAMVLVTDGIADPICASSQSSAAQAITTGFVDALSVKTYVIALGAGPTLLDPANIVDLSPLDTLADAGGTTRATRIEVNLSQNSELTTALDAIAAAAMPCAYAIPASIDASRAMLEWQPAGAAPIEWPRVSNESACGNRAGVFVRNKAPGYLELCPAACSVLRAGVTGTVWVRSACG